MQASKHWRHTVRRMLRRMNVGLIRHEQGKYVIPIPIRDNGRTRTQGNNHRQDAMPVFTRRRLQSMLDDLFDRMDLAKRSDMRARLESKRVDQVLPAEMELGVLWALARLGDVEIEPEWFGARRPDGYSEFLFAPSPCAVEVTAISDARLSQEDEMRRISARLCEFSNTVRKGYGNHLHFTFAEQSGYTPEGYVRRRKIDRDFVPDEATKQALRTWLEQADRSARLEVKQGNTHFVVTWHDMRQHPLSNFFSSMPAEAYSLEDNPLFEALMRRSIGGLDYPADARLVFGNRDERAALAASQDVCAVCFGIINVLFDGFDLFGKRHRTHIHALV